MDERITFKAEIEFKGSVAEFEKVTAGLAELPILIWARDKESPGDDPSGVWTASPKGILNRSVLERIAEGIPRIKVAREIPGGIRNPHLHIGDEVVILDRARFKELVGQVAMEVAGRLAERAEYAETVGAIRDLMHSVSASPEPTS